MLLDLLELSTPRDKLIIAVKSADFFFFFTTMWAGLEATPPPSLLLPGSEPPANDSAVDCWEVEPRPQPVGEGLSEGRNTCFCPVGPVQLHLGWI